MKTYRNNAHKNENLRDLYMYSEYLRNNPSFKNFDFFFYKIRINYKGI